MAEDASELITTERTKHRRGRSMCRPAWRDSIRDYDCKGDSDHVWRSLYKSRQYRGQPHRAAPTIAIDGDDSQSLLASQQCHPTELHSGPPLILFVCFRVFCGRKKMEPANEWGFVFLAVEKRRLAPFRSRLGSSLNTVGEPTVPPAVCHLQVCELPAAGAVPLITGETT